MGSTLLLLERGDPSNGGALVPLKQSINRDELRKIFSSIVHFNNNDIWGQDVNLLNFDDIFKAPPTIF